jgi:hypothetical protein
VGNKYKDKYISLRDIYKNIKKEIYKKINYSTYYNILKCYLKLLIRDVVDRKREVSLPNNMGYVYIAERPHKRAFHIRIDNEATKETGHYVKYKVPILNDFYKKLIWIKPIKYRDCKVMPLGYFKKIINKN